SFSICRNDYGESLQTLQDDLIAAIIGT
ncbi:unnamed protein product, partial [Rotaria magnacalcarata]